MRYPGADPHQKEGERSTVWIHPYKEPHADNNLLLQSQSQRHFFLVMTCSMWDPSSPTRDKTQTLRIRKMKSQPLHHQGNPNPRDSGAKSPSGNFRESDELLLLKAQLCPATTQKSMPSCLMVGKAEQTPGGDNQLHEKDFSLLPGRAIGQTHPGVTLKESIVQLSSPIE